MIPINTHHIPEGESLPIEGQESAALLELDEDSGLTPTGEIRYALSASMAGTDLIVTGYASFPATGVCARCSCSFPLEIRTGALCVDVENAVDRIVDISEQIREDLLLAIPPYLYCTEDCKGLCPVCGTDLNTAACTCSAAEQSGQASDGDSPWQALDGLDL